MMTTSRAPQLSVASTALADARGGELFDRVYDRVARRTDALFAKLMLIQWAAAVVVSSWLGGYPGVAVTAILGALIGALPLVLMRIAPGRPITRHVIAVAQVCWSALFLHLSGGRIETHFHVFGSLAILAFYRDFRVLISASVMVAVDHALRGVYWPMSIYGVVDPEWWRFLEHGAWILFIVVFLIVNCHHSRQDLLNICKRRAEIEVQQRAQAESDRNLCAERAATLAERARSEAVEGAYADLAEAHEQLREMQERLVEASRQAGMAEIATTVLHNVGNVLNSINVSTDMVQATVGSMKVDRVSKVVSMLQQHRDELGTFLADGDRGGQILKLLQKVGEQLEAQRGEIAAELEGLRRHVEHVKAVVRSQQEAAKSGGVIENVALPTVVDDALRLVQDSLDKHRIEVVREEVATGEVPVDRHRLLQIVVNLVGNAAQALRDHDGPRRITVVVGDVDGAPQITVRDTGPGVLKEIGDRVFRYGFTTKKDGHGFGLHASALLARELGGQLRLEPPVQGEGATFVLRLPARMAEAS